MKSRYVGKSKEGIDDLDRKLAANLRACRQKSGLTQKQAAEAVSVSISTIYRMEKGFVGGMRYGFFLKICGVYGVETSEIFEGI